MANPSQGKEQKKVKRPTQQKRQIQNEKCRLINKGARTRVKTAIKSCLDAIQEQDAEKKRKALNEFFSLVDKAAKKGIFKQNKADRMKSRVTSRFS